MLQFIMSVLNYQSCSTIAQQCRLFDSQLQVVDDRAEYVLPKGSNGEKAIKFCWDIHRSLVVPSIMNCENVPKNIYAVCMLKDSISFLRNDCLYCIRNARDGRLFEYRLIGNGNVCYSFKLLTLTLPPVLYIENLPGLAERIFICNPRMIQGVSSIMKIYDGLFVMKLDKFQHNIKFQQNKILKLIWSDTYIITKCDSCINKKAFVFKAVNESRTLSVEIVYYDIKAYYNNDAFASITLMGSFKKDNLEYKEIRCIHKKNDTLLIQYVKSDGCVENIEPSSSLDIEVLDGGILKFTEVNDIMNDGVEQNLYWINSEVLKNTFASYCSNTYVLACHNSLKIEYSFPVLNSISIDVDVDNLIITNKNNRNLVRADNIQDPTAPITNDILSIDTIYQVCKKYNLSPHSIHINSDNIVEYTFIWLWAEMQLTWNPENVVIVSDFDAIGSGVNVSNKYYLVLRDDLVLIFYNRVKYILYSKDTGSIKGMQRFFCFYDYKAPELLSADCLVFNPIKLLRVEDIEDFAKSIFICTPARINDVARFMKIPENHFIMSDNSFSYIIPLKNDKYLKVTWRDTLVITHCTYVFLSSYGLKLSTRSNDFVCFVQYRHPSDVEDGQSDSYIDIQFFQNTSSFVEVIQGNPSSPHGSNAKHDFTVRVVSGEGEFKVTESSEIIVYSNGTFEIQSNDVVVNPVVVNPVVVNQSLHENLPVNVTVSPVNHNIQYTNTESGNVSLCGVVPANITVNSNIEDNNFKVFILFISAILIIIFVYFSIHLFEDLF